MGLSRYIKSHDLLGHRVALNFNRKGEHHNTLCGGFTSILIKMLMLSYVAILVKKLILKEADNNFSTTGPQDLDSLGVIHFNSTKVHMLIHL